MLAALLSISAALLPSLMAQREPVRPWDWYGHEGRVNSQSSNRGGDSVFTIAHSQSDYVWGSSMHSVYMHWRAFSYIIVEASFVKNGGHFLIFP